MGCTFTLVHDRQHLDFVFEPIIDPAPHFCGFGGLFAAHMVKSFSLRFFGTRPTLTRTAVGFDSAIDNASVYSLRCLSFVHQVDERTRRSHEPVLVVLPVTRAGHFDLLVSAPRQIEAVRREPCLQLAFAHRRPQVIQAEKVDVHRDFRFRRWNAPR